MFGSIRFYKGLFICLGLIVLAGLLFACSSALPLPTPTAPPLAAELIIYDWPDDITQSILDAFQTEYGVKVTYLTYESQEEAISNIKAGKVYDAVVLENQLIPPLVATQQLAQINFDNVPNFKNISPNFRDLASDPNNQHTIPFTWGTTGLIVRTDLVHKPITRWADLWDPARSEPTVMWSLQRYLMGATLKSLGYSINSEDPNQLHAALQQMLALKTKITVMEYSPDTSADLLKSGQAAVTMGWATDALRSRDNNRSIVYVLPKEGSLLWGDNWVIPLNSPNKYTSELFLNFILRPEIDAQIVNHSHYATTNEAARALIKPEILNDPVIFPPQANLKNAEIILPLSAHGQALYDAIWTRFLAANSQAKLSPDFPPASPRDK